MPIGWKYPRNHLIQFGKSFTGGYLPRRIRKRPRSWGLGGYVFYGHAAVSDQREYRAEERPHRDPDSQRRHDHFHVQKDTPLLSRQHRPRHHAGMLFSAIFINEISVKSPRKLVISISYKRRLSVSQFPKIYISFDVENSRTDVYSVMYRYRITDKHSNNHVVIGVLTQDLEHMHAYKWRSSVDKSKAVVTHVSDQA